MAVQIDRHAQERLLTVEEFDRMAEVGILGSDERLELIDGVMYVLPPMNAPHASTAARFTHVLPQRLGGRALLWPQAPIVLTPRSKPLPDIALVRPREDYYRARLPSSQDVFAVVEVSDASLKFDRGVKLRAYARAGIREYWIIDVKAVLIEICRDPHNLGYATRTPAAKGTAVSFEAFPDAVFSVDELLG